jgi:hypothetical protein
MYRTIFLKRGISLLRVGCVHSSINPTQVHCSRGFDNAFECHLMLGYWWLVGWDMRLPRFIVSIYIEVIHCSHRVFHFMSWYILTLKLVVHFCINSPIWATGSEAGREIYSSKISTSFFINYWFILLRHFDKPVRVLVRQNRTIFHLGGNRGPTGFLGMNQYGPWVHAHPGWLAPKLWDGTTFLHSRPHPKARQSFAVL